MKDWADHHGGMLSNTPGSRMSLTVSMESQHAYGLVTQRDLYATTSVQELVDYVVHSANNIIEEDMDTGPTHGKLLRSQA